MKRKLRDGQKWRFKRITIDNAWVQGDPEISCRAEALAKEDQRPGRSPGSAREIEAAEITVCRSRDRPRELASRMRTVIRSALEFAASLPPNR